MHVSILCHLAMLSWPFVCLLVFSTWPPRRAVCLLTVLGYCFLPQTLYDLPGPFDYGKDTAIGMGVLLGLFWADRNAWTGVKWSWLDLPMLAWCACCTPSSMTNGLGFYDGISTSITRLMTWGACYLTGRAVFRKLPDFIDAFHAVVIGGLCYVPFCWFEMRMSPRLNQILYGFTTEALFSENYRYGGWRPGVFMNHGITTALWMGTSATAALILWLFAGRRKVMGLPIGLATLILFPTFLFSRSAGAWIVIFLVTMVLFAATLLRRSWPFALMMSVVPVYLLSRVMATVDIGWLDDFMRPNSMRLMWSVALVVSAFLLLCLDRRQTRLRTTFAVVPMILAASLLLLPLNNTWLVFAGVIGVAAIAAAARAAWPAVFMLLAIPVYHLDIPWLLDVTGVSFGADRASSLMTRIVNEDAMIAHILKRPVFGWGSGLRFMPTGPQTASMAIDSFWPTPLGANGIVGMVAVYLLIVGLPLALALTIRKSSNGPDRRLEWAGLTGCLACLGAGALYTLSAGYTFSLYPLLLGGVSTVLAGQLARPSAAARRPYARAPMLPNRLASLGLAEASV